MWEKNSYLFVLQKLIWLKKKMLNNLSLNLIQNSLAFCSFAKKNYAVVINDLYVLYKKINAIKTTTQEFLF